MVSSVYTHEALHLHFESLYLQVTTYVDRLESISQTAYNMPTLHEHIKPRASNI